MQAFNKIFPPAYTQDDVQDLQGRTALVTGGTKGIGYEVAKTLALAKARVLLLSRKAENGEEAVSEIKRLAREEEGLKREVDIEFIEVDLGNMRNVKEVADRIAEKEDRLDILVGDAGIGVNKVDVDSDGLERHMGVNHFGHFILINRLLPLIRKTSYLNSYPAPRIVMLSSELHRTAPSDVSFSSAEEVGFEYSNKYGPNKIYSRSKLANLLFVKYGLAERVFVPNEDRMLASAVHPGAVATDQQKQMVEGYGKLVGGILKTVVTPFMRDPEQGSFTALYAATSQDLEKNGWQGKYYTDPAKVGGESNQACDETLGKNLWELSHKIVKEKLGDDALLPWDAGKK